MQIADLEDSSRQVRRGSRPIALTAREYSLLLLLLEQRGTVVSRDRIRARSGRTSRDPPAM